MAYRRSRRRTRRSRRRTRRKFRSRRSKATKFRPSGRRAMIRYRPVSTVIRNAGYPLPDSTYVVLKFTDWERPSANLGSYTVLTYRANSPYDPDYKVGGNAAYGFNEMANLYNRYICYGSSASVRFYLNSGSEEGARLPVWCAVVPSRDNNLGIPGGKEADEVYEQVVNYPYARYKVRNAYDHAPVVSNYISTAKLRGISPKTIALNPQEYGATVTGNPGSSNQTFWNLVFGADPTAEEGLLDCVAMVTIKYWCKFYDRDHGFNS